MQLSVEISLYPLVVEDFEAAVWEFIKRIREYKELTIVTNGMSSQIFGDYEKVMACLTKEFKTTYEQTGTPIFVCKFLAGDRSTVNE